MCQCCIYLILELGDHRLFLLSKLLELKLVKVVFLVNGVILQRLKRKLHAFFCHVVITI